MALVGYEWLIVLGLPIIIVLALAVAFPAFRKALGIVLMFVGIVVTLLVPFIGWVFGIPTLFIGALFFFAGRRRMQVVQPVAPERVKVRCQACKALNDESAKFCVSCGARLS